MKKLLGLVTLAPMALAACGGLDSHQTVVKEVVEAAIAKGNIENCENYSVSTYVALCEQSNAQYEAIYASGGTASVSYSGWKTYEETEDGVVQVDVTVAIKATTSGVTVEAKTKNELFLTDHDGTWKIDSYTETLVD